MRAAPCPPTTPPPAPPQAQRALLRSGPTPPGPPFRLLNEATGSLLEDVQLVNTLQTSKVTATEVTEQLETSETTEINIDLAREVGSSGRDWGGPSAVPPGPDSAPPQAYRPCAQRASVLFFVLNDMGRIDPMYQFSLDAYIGLFVLSIDKSHRSHKLEDRIDYLNEYHTYAVYRSVPRTVRPSVPRDADPPAAPLLVPCSPLPAPSLGSAPTRGLAHQVQS